MLETAPIIIQTFGGTDWPAVTASISSGVAAVAAIGATLWQAKRGSDVQLQMAREQRIGERQTDTYLEILKWIRHIDENRQTSNFFELVELLTLSDELEISVSAFAVGEIRRRMEAFTTAWIALQNKLQRDEARIQKLFLESLKTRDRAPLFAAVPEWSAAFDAMDALRNSIRAELLGSAANADRRSKREISRHLAESWSNVMGPPDRGASDLMAPPSAHTD